MKIIQSIIAFGLLVLMASCDHEVEMHTEVNEDGSLKKTIKFIDADEAMSHTNPLGISAETGWDVKSGKVEMGEYEGKLQITLSKEFKNTEKVNEELNRPVDSLFQVESTFEREFRWFYTYLHYSETYKKIDRFNYINQADYFTQEDYDFIERLPGVGGAISKADSLTLDLLNEKVYDIYAMRGMYEEIYHFWERSFKKYNKDINVLESNKEKLFELFADDDADLDYEKDYEHLYIFDSLGVEFPRPEIIEDFNAFNREFEPYLELASWAGDGQFVNIIEMPWKVVSTNADTLENSTAIWRPLPFKYLLNDYKMTVTARKMNVWAVVISGLIVLITVVVIVRRMLR
jgi:tetratricopeptide (TPR) repeat protein